MAAFATPPPLPVVIRPAEPDDWPQLWPLLLAMGNTGSEAAAQERLCQLAGSSDHFIPLALAGAELVGYAWVQDYGAHLRGGARTARLHDLYVVPAWRRRTRRAPRICHRPGAPRHSYTAG